MLKRNLCGFKLVKISPIIPCLRPAVERQVPGAGGRAAFQDDSGLGQKGLETDDKHPFPAWKG